ncbi:uncharacterized protein LOC124453347 [Xenia sp. Carnegie-2017]|uniref:uncharacterized protein LOC124453347 n=1 Tax=Xenia sp. Carnegie-2017 TaxID=2897299 RepID=UPI001F04AD55|nr:uncharacterized protein LOC124453347 [Xenia sp. Carnegie-2017]XP_046860111.1 uncharacterized protein LOC124453347 [Xenia sp. Carnegie-2017]
MPSKQQENYTKKFQLVSVYSWIGYFIWNTCLGVIVFLPDLLPCELYGKMSIDFCDFAKEYNYGLKVLFVAVWVVHFFESLFSLRLSSKLGCSTFDQGKWFAQTMMNGYFSLHLLRKMNGMKKKHG